MPNYNVRLRKKSGNGWDTLYPESLANLIKTNGGSNVQVFMDTVYDKGATPNANGAMTKEDKVKLDNLGPRVDGLANDLANLSQGVAGDLTAVTNRINNVEQTVNGHNNQIAALRNDKADKNHHHDNRYLQLTGGTLTGNVNTNSGINFTTNNTGIKHNNNVIISNNGTSTIIGSINNSIFLRPQGYTTTTNQVTIATNGDVTANRFVGNLQGNAATATRLQNARIIQLTGAVTGQASFDGSQNIQINTTLANPPKGRLVRLRNRVTVNTTTKTVNIGIGAFNINNDFLNVYLAGVRLEPTVEYTNTQSQITLTGGNDFVNGDVVSFEVIQMQNATLANRLVRLRNRVAVTTTTNTVNIGIGAFNVNNDVLNVYLSGVRLEPTVDYTNTQSQITLTGTNNFVNGDVVSFEVIQMQ